MLIIHEALGLTGKSKVAEVADLAAAEAFLADRHKLVCFEVDADHPTCADAYAVTGQIYTVEPEGFTL